MVTGELKNLRITLEATDSGILGYVYLREIGRGQVARTNKVEPFSVMADYDAQGNLLGVEFPDARNATPPMMRELADKLSAPDLAAINLAELCRAAA